MVLGNFRLRDEDEPRDTWLSRFLSNEDSQGNAKSFWHLVMRDIVGYGLGTIVLILLFILVAALL